MTNSYFCIKGNTLGRLRKDNPLHSIERRPEKRPTDRKSSWRIISVVSSLVVLTIVFEYSGGFKRFCHSMAATALTSQENKKARWWLDFSKHFAKRDAYGSFLEARYCRLTSDFDGMAQHLKEAFDLGYASKPLDLEQSLALASTGQLTSELENKLNLAIQNQEGSFAEVAESYSNGLTLVSRFENAMELLRVWEEQLPGDPRPNYRLARIHEHLTQIEESEKQYRLALRKSSSFFKASYHLGRLLLDQKKTTEASDLFRDCLDADCSLAAKIGLAKCLKSDGSFDMARDMLQRVVEEGDTKLHSAFQSVDENPERAVALSELGVLETELGNYEVALTHLKLALDAFPLDSIAMYSYGVSLRSQGQEKEAAHVFEQIKKARVELDKVPRLQETVRSNITDSASRIQIGKIIMEYESERTGMFWIKSVFAYDPNNREAHQVLLDYLVSKPNAGEAIKRQADYHRSIIDSQAKK